MFPNQCLHLNSGYKIPQLGFGAFHTPNDVVNKVIEAALDVGFRHIDCAMIYGNEKEVGEGMITAMKKLNLKREDVLVTSKLWCDKHAPVDVRKACEMSIKNLGVDYLDLYLIHFPASFEMKDGVSIATIDPDSVVFEYHKLEDAWGAMEELVHAGLVRSIGVSNFNKRGQVRPVLEEECVVEIAHKHNKTPAQVLLRHGLKRGIVVLVRSVTPERIKSNFDVFDFELTDEETEKLNNIGVNKRIFWAPV